jgi:acyl dehydratase
MPEFATPLGQRYFEDYIEGSVFEFGPTPVVEAEVIAIAKRFDPQAMHTDPQAALRGPYKGLIASGWHTMGLMLRLVVDNYLSTVATFASPGLNEVRWLQPVRPGDELRLRVTVIETRVSRSKPDRGIVHSLMEGLNQNGDVVVSFIWMNMLGLRNPPPSVTARTAS